MASKGYSDLLMRFPFSSKIILVFIFRLKNFIVSANISSILPSILLLSVKRSPMLPISPNFIPGMTAQAINNCG